MANLLLDEVTGEKVSKTELKKRQKLREKEAKKKEKEAAAPPKTQKKASAEEEEANLTPNVSVSGFDMCGGIGLSLMKVFFFAIAILRNPQQENQQAPRNQVSRPLPSQVQRHR